MSASRVIARVVATALSFGALLFAISLLTIRDPVDPIQPESTWWLSLAVPGTAKMLAPLGLPALVALSYFQIVLWNADHSAFGATSYLETQNLPNTVTVFGLNAGLGDTWRGSLVTVARWGGWFIVALNLALVGIARLRNRTPGSAPAASFALSLSFGIAMVAAAVLVLRRCTVWTGFGLAGVVCAAIGIWHIQAAIRARIPPRDSGST